MLTYICGYLMKTRLEKRCCDVRINHARFQENFTDYFYFHILSRIEK